MRSWGRMREREEENEELGKDARELEEAQLVKEVEEEVDRRDQEIQRVARC